MLKEIAKMVMALLNIKVGRLTKGTSKMDKFMGKEFYIFPMEINILGNGKIDTEKAKEN